MCEVVFTVERYVSNPTVSLADEAMGHPLGPSVIPHQNGCVLQLLCKLPWQVATPCKIKTVIRHLWTGDGILYFASPRNSTRLTIIAFTDASRASHHVGNDNGVDL